METKVQLDKDLLQLMSVVIDRYASFDNSAQKIELGSLSVNISVEQVEFKNVPACRYVVVDTFGKNVLTFILGNASILFNKSMQKYREKLLSSENIKGVITLKQSLFSHSVIPAMIIIIGDNTTKSWFTTAETFADLIAVMSEHFPKGKKVFFSSEIKAVNFSPEYYNNENIIEKETFKGSTVKILAEVADVILGKSAKKEDYAETGIAYFKGKDIQSGKLQKTKTFINQEKVVTYSRQLLQEGDIVLTKNFGQNKLALVTMDDLPAIASDSLFIIRSFDVSEKYLYQYLTSETGKETFNKQLKQITTGFTIPTINLKSLKQIQVPIYDEITMQCISNLDTLTKDEVIKTSLNILKNTLPGPELEKAVFNDLLDAGWAADKIDNCITKPISFGINGRIVPDIIYHLDDGRTILIDVKINPNRIRRNWLFSIIELLNNDDKYIYILTTGQYYEVHIPGIKYSLKLLHVPSIEQILLWEKEVRCNEC